MELGFSSEDSLWVFSSEEDGCSWPLLADEALDWLEGVEDVDCSVVPDELDEAGAPPQAASNAREERSRSGLRKFMVGPFKCDAGRQTRLSYQRSKNCHAKMLIKHITEHDSKNFSENIAIFEPYFDYQPAFLLQFAR